jgi:hypothetical protein
LPIGFDIRFHLVSLSAKVENIIPLAKGDGVFANGGIDRLATATAAEILSGKVAYNKGNRLQGTMTNNGSVAGTISTKTGEYSIPKGYHDGSGKVTIDETEKSKLVGSNIRDGVTILGVTGTMSGTEGAKAQSKTVTPSATGPVTVTPDEGYNYLSQVTVEKISYQENDNSAGGITVTIA